MKPYYENENGVLYYEDCLDKMKDIKSNSVDMVLTDQPYGTTTCKWDTIIDFDLMWAEVKRVAKYNVAICLFGAEPFSSGLRMSNLEMFKFDYIWHHNRSSNFAQAPYRPLGKHEIISVFSKGGNSKNAKIRMKYYPQGLVRLGKNKTCNSTRLKGRSHRPSRAVQKNYTQEFTNYPDNILIFKKDSAKYHPTQKPVALLEHLIKTHTLKDETVLDFTVGSGSTPIACINTNRNFIGIDNGICDRRGKFYGLPWVEVSKQRIEAENKQLKLF